MGFLGGEFNVGEDLVYVSVAGSHRTDVFPALREAVERYKSEAPIVGDENRLLGIVGNIGASYKISVPSLGM